VLFHRCEAYIDLGEALGKAGLEIGYRVRQLSDERLEVVAHRLLGVRLLFLVLLVLLLHLLLEVLVVHGRSSSLVSAWQG
jgi:hypothetical protein